MLRLPANSPAPAHLVHYRGRLRLGRIKTLPAVTLIILCLKIHRSNLDSVLRVAKIDERHGLCDRERQAVHGERDRVGQRAGSRRADAQPITRRHDQISGRPRQRQRTQRVG